MYFRSWYVVDVVDSFFILVDLLFHVHVDTVFQTVFVSLLAARLIYEQIKIRERVLLDEKSVALWVIR